MVEIDYRKYDWSEQETDGSVIMDGNPYQMKIFSSCTKCKHYKGYKESAPVCSAFLKGIPPEIWLEKASHKKPYNGDHGIQFEPYGTED